MVEHFSVTTPGRGLHEITAQVQGLVGHTSASLVIQENADPSAMRDLERWLDRLVPDGDPFYRHDAEGPDDMPGHIKAALTASSLSITSGSTACAAPGAKW